MKDLNINYDKRKYILSIVHNNTQLEPIIIILEWYSSEHHSKMIIISIIVMVFYQIVILQFKHLTAYMAAIVLEMFDKIYGRK